MAATSFHRFNDLPTELRAHIIRHCLPNQRTITARNHINAYGYAVVNLRLVSRDVCALATQVYYEENTFLIARSRIAGAFASKVHVPHRGISPHIRKLDLRIEFRRSIETDLDLCGYDVYALRDEAGKTHWSTPSILLNLIRPNICVETPSSLSFRQISSTVLLLDERAADGAPRQCLAKPPSPEHRNRLTHWQKYFVGLVKLKVTTVAAGCLDAGARKLLKDLVRSSRTFLHAKQVEIVVLVDGCEEAAARLDMADNAGCDGRCANIMHGIFSELMGRAAKGSSLRRQKRM